MIAPVEKRDCGRLARIHALCFPKGWPAQEIARLAAEPGVMALKGGNRTASAFLLVRTVLDEAEILTLAVDPGQRRRGWARQLLAVAEQDLRGAGARKLFLEVSDANLAALSLYRQAGFEQTGWRKAYYSDGSDALVMEKSFAQ